MINYKKQFIYFILSAIILYSCSGKRNNIQSTELNIHLPYDPDMLNPVCYTTIESSNVLRNIFQGLIDVDYNSHELVPVLAEKFPKIEKTSEGYLKYHYRLRPEARWENGSPITARDVEFTIKAIKVPQVNDPQERPIYEHLADFIYDEKDPLQFTIVFDNAYILSEIHSGDYPIMPEYFYDPKGLLRNYTIKQLNSEKEKIENDSRIKAFADDFNSEKRMREKGFISGSGPYAFEEWVTGQKVVLIKKKNWWGDQLKEINMFFQANPEKINYRIINDMTTALTSLKAGNLDVMQNIKPKDFSELTHSQKINQSYNVYTPSTYSYSYLGLNSKRFFFAEKKTRQAMAHLLDINKLIETIMYGYAKPVIGPIMPSETKIYNSSIKPFAYDIDVAKQLLAEAGWKDSDADGLLDKVDNNKKTHFIVDFVYPSGNEPKKQIGLLLQEEARKVGIRINVIAQELSVLIENCKKHNFDMVCGGVASVPILPDLKAFYHSQSALNRGSNFCSFGTPESDSLIDSIRLELNETKRNDMYKKLQEIMHDDATYIFLFNLTDRIAIHKRFTNLNLSNIRPGYYEAGFKITESTD